MQGEYVEQLYNLTLHYQIIIIITIMKVLAGVLT